MGGTRSDTLRFPAQLCSQRLLVAPCRETLASAPGEDCLNNAWERAEQGGIHGPDGKMGLCSEETLLKCECTTATRAPGDGKKEMKSVISHKMLSAWCFETSPKAAHEASSGVWRERKRGT